MPALFIMEFDTSGFDVSKTRKKAKRRGFCNILARVFLPPLVFIRCMDRIPETHHDIEG